jgi:hypothetical protein
MREKEMTGNPLRSLEPAVARPAVPPVATAMTTAVVGAHFETGWFSADGHLYAAGGQNKAVRMWNLASGAFTTVATTDANVLTTCAAPDDSSFTVGAADGALKLCALTPQVRDGASATVLWEVNLARSEVCGTAFSRCGTWIAAVADDDSLQILEASSGATARMLGGSDKDFKGGSRWGGHSMHFSDTLFAASGGRSDFDKLRLWSLPAFDVVATIQYDDNVYCWRRLRSSSRWTSTRSRPC